MGDLVSGWAGLLHFVMDTSCALLRFVKALLTFNYQVVTTLVAALVEGTKALVTIAITLSRAGADICCYIVELLAESYDTVDVVVQYAARVAHYSYKLAAVTAIYLIDVAHHIFLCCMDYATIVSNSCGELLLVLVQHIRDVQVYVYAALCRLWVSASKDAHSFAASSRCTLQGFSASLSSGFQDLWCSFKFTLGELSQWLHHKTHNSVLHLPIVTATLSCFVAVLLSRMLLAVLHRHGFTFPHPNTPDYAALDGRGHPAQRNLEYSDASDSEADIDRAETDDILVLVAQNDSDTVTVSSSGEEELEIPSSDDMESSDEDEENNQNIINVQLPPRNGRYNLRHGLSPCEEREVPQPDELARILEAERDRRLCVVCQEEAKSVLLLPCKHMCLCVECAHEITSARHQHRRVCPLCRSHIHTVMNVFV